MRRSEFAEPLPVPEPKQRVVDDLHEPDQAGHRQGGSGVEQEYRRLERHVTWQLL